VADSLQITTKGVADDEAVVSSRFWSIKKTAHYGTEEFQLILESQSV
jgi:hypothetical protein